MPCSVPVGLFGLQMKRSPAPRHSSYIACRSTRSDPSTATSRTGTPWRVATSRGVSKVGATVTSARDGEVNAWVTKASTSVEPQPRITESTAIRWWAAIAARSSSSGASG